MHKNICQISVEYQMIFKHILSIIWVNRKKKNLSLCRKSTMNKIINLYKKSALKKHLRITPVHAKMKI